MSHIATGAYMDELIVAFINDSYSDELKQEIYKSFILFDKFEYDLAYQDFIDLLMYTVNMTNDDVRDNFIRILHSKLDYILQQHTIKLVDDVSLEQKNMILDGLYLVQDLEDYTGIIRELESFNTDHEQLATVLADLCSVEQVDILVLIEDFSPVLLTNLKNYIYGKEQLKAQTDVKEHQNIITTLKLFFKLYGEDNIGHSLIVSNVALNQTMELYLEYSKGAIVVDNDHQTASNILSIIYMTSNGINNPIEVYRNYSSNLIGNLNQISRIEALIIRMVAKINEHKQAERHAESQQQQIVEVNKHSY